MNKFNKAKTIGLISASLAGVSLIGVGFSAWVINGEKSDSTNNIQVEVGDVIDNRISITDVSVSDGIVKFDAKSSATTDALLGVKDGAEDLTFSIKYTINNSTASNKFHVFAYIASNNQAIFTDAVGSKNLIVMPDALNIVETGTPINSVEYNGTDVTYAAGAVRENGETGSSIFTVTQTFTFKWGTAFFGKNPSEVTASDKIYDVANSKADQDATVELLKNNITALKNLQSSLSNFKVVLQPRIDA